MAANDMFSATRSNQNDVTSGSIMANGDARHPGNSPKNSPTTKEPATPPATRRPGNEERQRSTPTTIISVAPPPAISSRNGPPKASHTGAARECNGNSRPASSSDDPDSAAPNMKTGRDTAVPRQ